MTEHHANLRVAFYPADGQWSCVVQRLGADGMPEADVLSAAGSTKHEAWTRALASTDDEEVRQALRDHEPEA
jgi:hypothetical protein